MTFSPFDWPYTITKLIVTSGYPNQSTGVWVPESTASSSIVGHVSDFSVKELSYIDPGIVAIGVRKLAVESTVTLSPGDRVQIHEDSTGSNYSEWNVESLLVTSGLLNSHAGINRNTYMLSRRT